jgi:hypothetical protein
VTGAPKGYVRNGGGGVTAVAGVIGRADSIYGTGGSATPTNGSFIDLARDSAGNNLTPAYAGYSDFTTGFTYSVWVKPTAHTNFARYLMMAQDSLNAANSPLDNRILLMARRNVDGNIVVRWGGETEADNGQLGNPQPLPGYVLGEWNHCFMIKDPGTGPIRVYRNGTLLGSTINSANDASIVDRNIVWLGRTGANDPWAQAVFDNPTLAKTVRSADFVKLSYETQKAGATGVVLGATQQQVPIPVHGAVRPVLASFSVKAQGAGALFRIAESASATVSVMDVRGQVVWSGSFASGARELSWDGANASSGLYVARLSVLDKQGRATSVDRRLTLAR